MKEGLLSAIGQIALSVTNLEESIAFYRTRVGLEFLFQAPNVAFFNCGGVRLMLGLNEQPASPFHGTVIYFRVDDIEVRHAELTGRGVPNEQSPHLVVRLPDHELWMSFYRDPDGNLFALMEERRG